jgi:hypothetical protein
MKVFYTLNLPASQGNDLTRWNNCLGSFSASNGIKYVGEWMEYETGMELTHIKTTERTE